MYIDRQLIFQVAYEKALNCFVQFLKFGWSLPVDTLNRVHNALHKLLIFNFNHYSMKRATPIENCGKEKCFETEITC